MSTASSDRGRAPGARLAIAAAAAFVVCTVATQLLGQLPAGASPSMQSTGSSFASDAIQEWVGQSSTLFGLNINWQVQSSVIGLNDFAQNQVDFAASDIPYSSQQATYSPNQAYQYMPDVAGGLAFMFNLNGQDGQRISNLNLNAAVIGKIFFGEITSWNDPSIAALNPQLAGDLPDQPIVPVYRADASGENYLLTDYLLHQDNADIVAAQNAFQSGLPGQPSATWPTPAAGTHINGSTYPNWVKGTPSGQTGSSNAANYVTALSSLGAITYVETAYAKSHNMPVANLQNASGADVQPSSVNVATALEAAQLHVDLTQDLTSVYTNPQANAYPLSAYSYIVSPCAPDLAAASHTACAGGPGATSPFPTQKGQALGQFVAFLACAGQGPMAQLGYSPLPPVLVQADFDAIGRLDGGQQPPPPTAANCKNPYVDGDTVLPGSPVVAGFSGGGVTATTTASAATSAGGAAAVARTSAGGSTTAGGRSSGSGGSGGSGGSSGVASAAAAAGLTPELAAQGYTVVNGQVVRKLGVGGPNEYLRADALVAATSHIASPRAMVYVGWSLFILGLILLPPLIAMRISRRRQAAAGGGAGEPEVTP